VDEPLVFDTFSLDRQRQGSSANAAQGPQVSANIDGGASGLQRGRPLQHAPALRRGIGALRSSRSDDRCAQFAGSAATSATPIDTDDTEHTLGRTKAHAKRCTALLAFEGSAGARAPPGACPREPGLRSSSARAAQLGCTVCRATAGAARSCGRRFWPAVSNPVRIGADVALS
jgi:hypothetical protein